LPTHSSKSGKVFLPTLPAGIEEPDQLASHWICRFDFGVFVTVTPGTGKRQIVETSLSATRLRNNVINSEWPKGIARRAAAIFTAPSGSSDDSFF